VSLLLPRDGNERADRFPEVDDRCSLADPSGTENRIYARLTW
jgi:hypothetical protein